jgi:HSP20 family protein
MNNNNLVEVQEQKVKGYRSLEEIFEKERMVAPLVDIYETENEFMLVANMPGVSRQDIQLKMEEDSIIIFGKINYNNILNRKYILNENEIGNYYRKFRISSSVDESKIDAKMENGQLLVTLPKHDRVKPRKIEIK